MNWIKEIYPIFQVIQSAKIFEDQKYFADCIPIGDLATIRTAFEKVPNNPLELRNFVEEYFEMPKVYAPGSKEKTEILQHIDALWSVLTVKETEDKGSLIGVPEPYVLPGGRFREFYYWDSFFTMLGLEASGRVPLLRSMVHNFSFLIQKIGFIPNGNRTYLSSRSQPPFFALMIDLLAQTDGEQVLLDHYKNLEKEYAFWMKGKEKLTAPGVSGRVVLLEGGAIGNRYFDPENQPRPESYMEDAGRTSPAEDIEIYQELRSACESGWDFSSRWMQDASDLDTTYTTQIMPVDLNCLLFFLEKMLAKCYALLGDKNTAEKYQQFAANRKTMINNYFWKEDLGLYQDYSIQEKKSTPAQTLATLYPLFLNIAPANRAQKVLDQIEKKFLKKGGLITSLRFSGQQWDAPNAWAPLQYIAYIAAKNYQRNQLADRIKNNWMSNVESVFKHQGKLTEKYNAIDTSISAEGGEYPNQDGFGWTNGVYLFFAKIK